MKAGVARTGFAILVAFTAIGVGVADALNGQNDAGSGIDAGNTPETSLRISGIGAFEGNLTDPDPADWYAWKLPSKDAVCLQATLTSTSLIEARLVHVAPDATREVTVPIMGTKGVSFGIAAPDATGGLLAVDDYGLGTVTSPDYHFTFARLKTSQIQADTGYASDAPPTVGLATNAQPGCLGGKLDPAAGDSADSWVLSGSAGDSMVVSFADTTGAATARVLSASGEVVATILAGGISQVTLPSTGTYSMAVTSASATTFVLGLCDPGCEPPESPCQPMCAIAVESLG